MDPTRVRRHRREGFSLIEMMVALTAGLIAITAIYGLGATSTKTFHEQQRIATAQAATRMAIEELRHDILRGGLFGTPNGNKERSCETAMTLPLLGGGSTPVSPFQYYADYDSSIIDPAASNSDDAADRLRILGNLYTSDRYLIASISTAQTVMLQEETQAYRRSFLRGQESSYTSGTGFLAGTQSGQLNALATLAFAPSNIAHIETAEGMHFFRPITAGPVAVGTTFTQHLSFTGAVPLGTACFPGVGEGATVAPLSWVEYLVVDPAGSEVPTSFMSFLAATDADDAELAAAEPSALESTNRVLVRRRLDTATGSPITNDIRIVADWVTKFQISFLVDANSGIAGTLPSLSVQTGSTAQATVNTTPERIRSVIVDLSVRSPAEDSQLKFVVPDAGLPTRWEVDTSQTGSARLRHAHMEIPISNLARRNL